MGNTSDAGKRTVCACVKNPTIRGVSCILRPLYVPRTNALDRGVSNNARILHPAYDVTIADYFAHARTVDTRRVCNRPGYEANKKH